MPLIDDQTIEIVTNEFLDIKSILMPRVVMRRLPVNEGTLVLLEFTVTAPTYYITGPNDNNPKPTDSIKFFIDVKNGFPKVKPYVYYEAGKILASVNAFTNGAQCIDEWIYDAEHAGRNSSLVCTVKKTIMDIIHDPVVSRYDSMANSSLQTWQKNKTASGEFPTCRLNTLIKTGGDIGEFKGRPALPTNNSSVNAKIRPALPTRQGV